VKKLSLAAGAKFLDAFRVSTCSTKCFNHEPREGHEEMSLRSLWLNSFYLSARTTMLQSFCNLREFLTGIHLDAALNPNPAIIARRRK
jgi:hypothetical protein